MVLPEVQTAVLNRVLGCESCYLDRRTREPRTYVRLTACDAGAVRGLTVLILAVVTCGVAPGAEMLELDLVRPERAYRDSSWEVRPAVTRICT